MPGISTSKIAIPFNSGGIDYLHYWTTLSKVLFLWSGKFDGDNLLSDIDDTVITVTGKDFATTYIPYTSAATFAVPDNATYEAADDDLMWFDSSETPKTVAIKQLVNFDYTRTIIKYDDESPYHVRGIMILKDGEVLTADEIDRMHRDFGLWVYWGDVENENGHYKDNRTIVDVPAVASAEVPSGQSTKVAITFDLNLDEDTIPATTDFTLTGSITGAKIISNVAVAGTIVTLTVTVAFDDETVVVTYTKPADNSLRSALGGGGVVTFAGQSVTNNLYGPEIVINGDFSSATGWVLNGSVNIAGGVGVFTGDGNFQQLLGVQSGKIYKTVYTVTRTSGNVCISLGTFATWRMTSGTFTEIVTATDNYFYILANTTPDMSIDNVSIKEIL